MRVRSPAISCPKCMANRTHTVECRAVLTKVGLVDFDHAATHLTFVKGSCYFALEHGYTKEGEPPASLDPAVYPLNPAGPTKRCPRTNDRRTYSEAEHEEQDEHLRNAMTDRPQPGSQTIVASRNRKTQTSTTDVLRCGNRPPVPTRATVPHDRTDVRQPVLA